MKITAIRTRIGVFVGTAAFCAGAAFAQQSVQQYPPPPQAAQPAAFQPAPAPMQLQQPVQAQQIPPPPPTQGHIPPPAPQQGQMPPPPPPPPQQGQLPPPPGAQSAVAAPAQDLPGGAGKSAAPKRDVVDAKASVRLGVELSAEALAATPYLYYNDGKNPGVGRVVPPQDRGIYHRFDKVTVKPIVKDMALNIGDTVDLLKPIRKLKVSGERARLVARTARGVVLGFAGKDAVIRLVDVWGKVAGYERVVKSTPFIPVYIDNQPAAPKVDIKARVVLYLDRSVVPYMQQYIVVDKGSDAGVRLGDFFRVMDQERSNYLSEELVDAQVINVTAKASTLLLHKVHNDRLRFGDEAYLSFRAAPVK